MFTSIRFEKSNGKKSWYRVATAVLDSYFADRYWSHAGTSTVVVGDTQLLIHHKVQKTGLAQAWFVTETEVF